MSTRKRLLVKYTSLSLASVIIASAVFVAVRNRSERYTPGQPVEGITSELDRTVPTGYPKIEFVDVARQAGINFVHFSGKRSTQLPEDMGSGVAWGDYDGDGDADLFLAGMAAPLTASAQQIAAASSSNRLYRNNSDGTFTDVTEAAGLAWRGIAMAAAWGDYNNDGRLDLVVTTDRRILLYRNRGDGTFLEVSSQAGLAEIERFWAGASWADYDQDGDLDLYVCAYVDYRFQPDDLGKSSRQFTTDVPHTLNPSSYPPAANALFRNNGNGSFSEVAKAAGVDNPSGRSLTASWCDFDLDERLDLYVANDVSDNAMYRNLGNGRFEDISHPAMVADYRGAMGLAVGDYDNDGDQDIFITHWIAQENALMWNMLRSPGVAADASARLRFNDIADLMGLGQQALNAIGWGTFFFDYDNDGLLDLFVVNGSTFQQPDDPARLVPMRNFLMWQKSAQDGFFDVGPVSGAVFRELHVGRGAAFADYDRDGDLDVAVVNHGEPPLLLRNDGGNRNRWLRVEAPPGAVVEIEHQGRRQWRAVGCQPSYLSQNEEAAHFGLANATNVDRVRVRFLNNRVREMHDVASNQVLRMRE